MMLRMTTSGDAIRAERLKKLELLKAAGMEAYPAHTNRDTSVADFVAKFEELESHGKSVTLAGRVMSKRGQGGIAFVDIFDGEGRVQIVLQESEMDAEVFKLFNETVDIGDFIEASGIAFKTQRGAQSLKVVKWKMLAKSLLPIPSEWFGVKDEETILRQRYLDILLNAETRAMFERRAKFWQAIRQFYLDRGFLEVESPVLETSPGGADARPFITHHNALDIDVYLRIALELWHKRVQVAGFPKVFEIGRVFRNEGQSREHLQDFTFLESYEAFSDMTKGMEFIKELYRHVVKEVYGKYTFEIGEHTVDFAEEWPLVNFSDAIKEQFGVDPLGCTEEEAIQAARDAKVLGDADDNKSRAIDQLWKSIRKQISGPSFLVGVPVYLEPLAKRSSQDPRVVDRFQVLMAGSEMGKGFSELNDPLDQRARFEEQQKMRDAGDDEAQRLDEDYVKAMEYGMPPMFGFGVSERLFAFLENRPAHETQMFPLLRPKNEVETGKSKDTMVAAIVLNTNSLDAQWKELNTTAHLAASFAARQGTRLFLQDTVTTKDKKALPLNIQHAIMIRQTDSAEELYALMQSATKSEFVTIPFTKEMLETTDDKKVAKLTSAKAAKDVEYLGVLVFGKKRAIDSMTEKYTLHS